MTFRPQWNRIWVPSIASAASKVSGPCAASSSDTDRPVLRADSASLRFSSESFTIAISCLLSGAPADANRLAQSRRRLRFPRHHPDGEQKGQGDDSRRSACLWGARGLFLANGLEGSAINHLTLHDPWPAGVVHPGSHNRGRPFP